MKYLIPREQSLKISYKSKHFPQRVGVYSELCVPLVVVCYRHS